MRNSVSISLPDQILKEVKTFCSHEKISMSELARNAFRSYLVDVEMDNIRNLAIREAARKGMNLKKITEDDISDMTS